MTERSFWPWWSGGWNWTQSQEQPGGFRHTVNIYEFTGFQESTSEGEFVLNRGRGWNIRNLVETVSTVLNVRTKQIGPITNITEDRFDTPGIVFQPGDFFIISTPFANPWTLQNDDMPVIEIDCKRCGFSYPRSKLTNGLCSVCQDEPTKK